MVAQAVAFSLWSVQLLAGTYTPGATLLDPLWVVGLVAIGVGGLIAARAPEEVAELDEPARRGGVLPGVMFAALLAVSRLGVSERRSARARSSPWPPVCCCRVRR